MRPLQWLLLCPLSSALAEKYVAWSSVSHSAGPGGRVSMASTAKAIAETAALGDELWFFGGISSTHLYSAELWRFDTRTATWLQFPKPGSPPALEGSVMCAVGHKLHVFGGADVTLDPRDDLYVFDTHTLAWSIPGAAGTAPSARSYHAMALMEESIFLFGGSDAQSQPLGDVHVLAVATDALRWTQPSMLGTAPSARKGHTLTKSGAYLYLFGGKGAGDALLNDVHELDANRVSWRTLQTTGALPPGRDGHTATAVDDRMYVFGGASSQGKLNDVRVLDLHTLRWSVPRSVGGPPGPRWGHSATLIAQQIYIFGGVDQGQQVLSDIWAMARHCQGPLVLTSSRDSFSSGDGLYQANANCSWLMAPTEPNRQVALFFSSFELEQEKDWVRVYDGSAAVEPLYSFTGSDLPSTVLSTAGSLLVTFTSDGMVSGEGFQASYYTLCAAGYVPDTYNPDECLPCEAGSYSAQPGLLECTLCSRNSYSDVAGASACKDCPALAQALDLGSSALSECFCLPGYIRNGSSCGLCPKGAECPGHGAAVRSREGWCRSGEQFLACCDARACPAGDAECPASAATAAHGEDECPEVRLLTMSVLTFVLVAVALVVVGACCWCAGFAKGMRRGASDALHDIVAPFRNDISDDQAIAQVEAFAAQSDVPADDVAVVDAAQYVEAEPARRPALYDPRALTSSMQASPVGSAGGVSLSSRAPSFGVTPGQPPRYE